MINVANYLTIIIYMEFYIQDEKGTNSLTAFFNLYKGSIRCLEQTITSGENYKVEFIELIFHNKDSFNSYIKRRTRELFKKDELI